MLQDVPKELIVEFLDSLQMSRYSSDFDPKQISDFLSSCADSSIDVFDVAFMDGGNLDKAVNVCGKKLPVLSEKPALLIVNLID